MQTSTLTLKDINKKRKELIQAIQEIFEIQKALDSQICEAEEAGDVPRLRLKNAIKCLDAIDDTIEEIKAITDGDFPF